MAIEQAISRYRQGTATQEDMKNLQSAGVLQGGGGGAPQDYHNDAEVFQNLSGAASGENPYLPFLQPKVVDRDGKRFLRIPKNQELLKLGQFFDENQSTKFKTANDFAKTYLDFLEGGTGGRKDQQLELDRVRVAKSGSSGTKDRKLTISEAQKLGVPIGTMLSQVEGQNVPGSTTTKRYEDFVKEANLTAGNMSRDPRSTYQDYLEAQQLITQQPDKFTQIRNDPRAAPYAHLLKPKSSNDLFDLFSGLLGGTEIDTSQ